MSRQQRRKIQAAGAEKRISFWVARLRRPAFLSLLLAAATLAVFLPGLRNEFVNYDDPDYVTANSHVQAGLKWNSILWAFKTGHASNWHPITWLSHCFDWQLLGDHAWGHHLVSLLFHTLNAILLFLAFRRMTGALWRSAVVAALFALHPLRVESVIWVSERKDVLSGFFFLLTILAYARYTGPSAEAPLAKEEHLARPTAQSSTLAYLLALVFFALGLMSKPMLVTLPFVLLLLDYWPLRRWRLFGRGEQTPSNVKRPSLFLLLIEKVPFLLLGLASSCVTFLVQKKGGAVSTSISAEARIDNALVSYIRYLGKTIWPADLSVLYPHPGKWPAWQVVGSAVLLLLILGAVLLLGRRKPYLPVGWLWFFGMLIPTIGLVQVGIQSMADRYTYLPSIGLFVMLVWGIADALLKRPTSLAPVGVVAAAALGTCACVSVRQVLYWRNSETLFRRVTQVTRNNYLAYNNLGFYLSGKGKTQEAIDNYRKALEINPAYEDAQNNLGYALAGQKKYAEAMEHYMAALRIRPNHPEVHNNLGNALAEVGQVQEAIQHYLFVLKEKPDHADAHNNLGIALAMQGKVEEAMPHFYAAIRVKPDYAGAHSNLGNALAAQHKIPEAIQEYRLSLRLKPDDAQAHNNLGNALAEQGRGEEAIPHYQEALRLNADNPEAHYNLAMVLLKQGKRPDAMTHFRDALRLKPGYPEALSQLSALEKAQAPTPKAQ